ncbi:Protein DSF2 [Zancudomyces culisetae]|uniref:Protein DSF2 n=1 Tax=Zancudomyces culisetae TaxID=1213189 RepID=A0A1R1PX80_ZANCU|nr:Protein DSF2 [Zancudomyces culisetae]|eukprot:OMH85571.1 Protein DSF2 [Zancudomyces culisetae]
MQGIKKFFLGEKASQADEYSAKGGLGIGSGFKLKSFKQITDPNALGDLRQVLNEGKNRDSSLPNAAANGGADNFDDNASYHSFDSCSSEEGLDVSGGEENLHGNDAMAMRGGGRKVNFQDDLVGIRARNMSTSSGLKNQNIPGELPPSLNRLKDSKAEKREKGKVLSQEDHEKLRVEKAEKYFQAAIKKHESGDYTTAASLFKKSADLNNPLGLLFFGLCLRHGWGCQRNEKMAFLYLQKAGESIVPEVKNVNPSISGAAKEELAMAIYELGQSYYHGWGVPQSKKTAVHYFELAADLGDADSQTDLARCYERGEGVKRNLKTAAHYYRLAHAQGVESFGNSWIFKKKYDSDG